MSSSQRSPNEDAIALPSLDGASAELAPVKPMKPAKLPTPKKKPTRLLFHAIQRGDMPACLKALQEGASPNGRVIKSGDTPLCAAVGQRSHEMVALLLEAGADPEERGEMGETPLMVAIAKQSVACVRLLARVSDLSALTPHDQSMRDQADWMVLGAQTRRASTETSALILSIIESEPERRRAIKEAEALREALGTGSAPAPKMRV